MADFRDPWTTIGYHKQLKLSSWAAKTQRFGKEVMNTCDQLLVTSPTKKPNLKRLL